MGTKIEAVKKIVLSILEDGEEHSTEEIRNGIRRAGIEISAKSSSLRTAIYQLRNSGVEIYSRDRGIYQIKGKQKVKEEFYYLKDFIILKPEKKKSPKCVYVHRDGNVVLNGKLNEAIKDRQIEIRVSKDGKRLALLVNGDDSHKFTKSGCCRNQELITLLEEKEIIFPVTYEMEWDNDLGVWLGELYLAPTSKK